MNSLLILFLTGLTAITIPIVGAVGYVHGKFATVARVQKLELRINTGERATLNSYKLICKMAIRQKLKDAEEICTEPIGDKK